MPSPPAEEEEAADVLTEEEDSDEEEEEEWSDEALAGARVSAAAEEEDGDDGGEPRTTCCVCMESWTCSGAHRLCCIPCGHVYGRSCLEKWLSARGNTTATCPQCGKAFGHKHITNLYAPGNLWDDCCHIQEVEAHYSRIAKYAAELVPIVRRHASEIKSEAQLLSGVAENAAMLEVVARSVRAENQATDMKVVQDVLAVVMTNCTMVKGQLEMARRHYLDLIEFVMQSFDGLLELDSK